MRPFRFALLILLPLSASERGLGGGISDDELATVGFIEGLRDRETGAFKNTAKDKPSLRATNGAVKALKALGTCVGDEKMMEFVLGCYDSKDGSFAEPGGKPYTLTTCIGIIVAREIGIPAKEIPKALGHVLAVAHEFEEFRMASAAVEAWDTEDLKLGELREALGTPLAAQPGDARDGGARQSAAVVVSWLRLRTDDHNQEKDWVGKSLAAHSKSLAPGQCDDGGWRKKGEKASDMESTYRVMRAFKMLGSEPKDVPQLRKFIASHRNKDGGYGAKPGDASSAGGTYFAVIVTKWLDEMDAKK